MRKILRPIITAIDAVSHETKIVGPMTTAIDVVSRVRKVRW